MRDFSKTIRVKNEDPQKLQERKKFLEFQIRGLSKNEDLLNDAALRMLKGYKEEYDALTRKLQQMR